MRVVSRALGNDEKRWDWIFWGAAIALLAAALALRLWRVRFGLPTFYHPDDQNKLGVIAGLLNGEKTSYLKHPCFMINATTVLILLLRGIGLSVEQPAAMILAGRVLNAVVGALTLVPAALLGRLLFNRRAGLLAASFVAFAPLHVITSRYIKEDIFLTFWSLVACTGLAALIRSTQTGPTRASRKWVVAAVIGTGFAAASKYVGLLTIPVMAWVFLRHGRLSKSAVWAAVAAVVVLALAVSPQFLWAGHEGMNDVNFEFKHGVMGFPSVNLWIHQWPDWGFFFLFHGLGWGLSWPIALLAIAGVIRALRRSEDPALRLAAWMACMWYVVGELTPIKRAAGSERYVLACVPYWAVMAAGMLTAGFATRSNGWRRLRQAWRMLPLPVLALPLVHSLAIGLAMEPDTRQIAAKWLMKNRMGKDLSLVYLGNPSYQMDFKYLKGIRPYRLSHDKTLKQSTADKKHLAESSALVTSDLMTGRFDAYPRLSGKLLGNLQAFRDEFPYVRYFRKNPWVEAGYHNPVIEVRFKDPAWLRGPGSSSGRADDSREASSSEDGG